MNHGMMMLVNDYTFSARMDDCGNLGIAFDHSDSRVYIDDLFMLDPSEHSYTKALGENDVRQQPQCPSCIDSLAS